MSETISHLTCGDDTITLTEEEKGQYCVAHWARDCTGTHVIFGARFEKQEDAVAMFCFRVTSLHSCYLEKPPLDDIGTMIKKVAAIHHDS